MPQSGRTAMVAFALSLGLHAVAIAGAGLWAAYTNPRSSEPATCPVTQFMKVHLIKAPAPAVAAATPAPQTAPQQLASTRPAATKPVPAKNTTKPQPQHSKTEAAAIPSSHHPVISSSHSDFIAEAPQAQAAAGSTISSSHHPIISSSPVLAKVQAGTNTAITYPAAARKMGWEGTVTLMFWLNEQGRPSQLSIAGSSGFPVLDAKALQTVKSWRFEQSATWAQLPVAFQLTSN